MKLVNMYDYSPRFRFMPHLFSSYSRFKQQQQPLSHVYEGKYFIYPFFVIGPLAPSQSALLPPFFSTTNNGDRAKTTITTNRSLKWWHVTLRMAGRIGRLPVWRAESRKWRKTLWARQPVPPNGPVAPWRARNGRPGSHTTTALVTLFSPRISP